MALLKFGEIDDLPKFTKFSPSKFLHIYRVLREYRTNLLEDISYADAQQLRGVGTGPADPATAGPEFPVHQESLQFSNINCNQATSKFYFAAAYLY